MELKAQMARCVESTNTIFDTIFLSKLSRISFLATNLFGNLFIPLQCSYNFASLFTESVSFRHLLSTKIQKISWLLAQIKTKSFSASFQLFNTVVKALEVCHTPPSSLIDSTKLRNKDKIRITIFGFRMIGFDS